MRVQDVMTADVETIAPTATADAAWERMRLSGFHHLIVTRGSEVLGVLSDRDIGGRRGASLRANHTVTDLMSAPAVCVAPDTTVRRAANLMRGRSLGCLVVTANNRVTGIVTASDLLELLGRGALQPSPTARRWTLKHRAPHRKQHAAYGVW